MISLNMQAIQVSKSLIGPCHEAKATVPRHTQKLPTCKVETTQLFHVSKLHVFISIMVSLDYLHLLLINCPTIFSMHRTGKKMTGLQSSISLPCAYMFPYPQEPNALITDGGVAADLSFKHKAMCRFISTTITWLCPDPTSNYSISWA